MQHSMIIIKHVMQRYQGILLLAKLFYTSIRAYVLHGIMCEQYFTMCVNLIKRQHNNIYYYTSEMESLQNEFEMKKFYLL